MIADLQEFEIYRCPSNDQKRPAELTSLHLFDVKAKHLCFDGYVVLGGVRHRVQRVSIEDFSIEGYGEMDSPQIVAYVQSKLASRDTTHDIWLRLKDPAPGYERFHTPFLWVSTFGKVVLDYLDDRPQASVALEDFRVNFHHWLIRRFGMSGRFKTWFAAFHNRSDFRVALNAYVDYIYNQAVHLSTSVHLLSHPVWSHCKCNRTMAIERQPTVVEMTIATPHVFESFKHMYFASRIKESLPSKAVGSMQEERKQALGFAANNPSTGPNRRNANKNPTTTDIRAGDVVSISPNGVDRNKWPNAKDDWLAYVQDIEPLGNGKQRLLVLWLYRPADTNMYHANYPVTNELFFSDNCNCGEREILMTDVVRKHNVEWSPTTLDTSNEFIIRQTYMTQASAFVTMRDDHKTCGCRKPKAKPSNWSTGDTVYITNGSAENQFLEPVVIQEIDYGMKVVKVQTLLRLARDCFKLARKAKRARIAPNELVVTDQIKTLSISQIERACHVSFIIQDDVLKNRIPRPFDQGGAGDYWFFSMVLQSTKKDQRLIFLEALPKIFREAKEAPLPCGKLRGLSLFGGGGSLDRGLEDGGAVEFQTSVDYNSAAIHTQLANCRNPQRMRLFYGSVDDYIQALLSGAPCHLVARVGEVHFIAAGSPCPGTLSVFFMWINY